MTPGAAEFLLRFREALWGTPARPLVELRQDLPSLADVAESVRQAAAASPDFWGYFSGASGRDEVARALLVLREGAWQVDRGDVQALAAAVCQGLRA